jgi:hypothetical protein
MFTHLKMSSRDNKVTALKRNCILLILQTEFQTAETQTWCEHVQRVYKEGVLKRVLNYGPGVKRNTDRQIQDGLTKEGFNSHGTGHWPNLEIYDDESSLFTFSTNINMNSVVVRRSHFKYQLPSMLIETGY